jgi:hypothetical protein
MDAAKKLTFCKTANETLEGYKERVPAMEQFCSQKKCACLSFTIYREWKPHSYLMLLVLDILTDINYIHKFLDMKYESTKPQGVGSSSKSLDQV